MGFIKRIVRGVREAPKKFAQNIDEEMAHRERVNKMARAERYKAMEKEAMAYERAKEKEKYASKLRRYKEAHKPRPKSNMGMSGGRGMSDFKRGGGILGATQVGGNRSIAGRPNPAFMTSSRPLTPEELKKRGFKL